MKSIKVFLSASFFSKAEYDFNKAVAKRLRKAGYDVWLPQDHPLTESPSIEEKRTIYDNDVEALRESDAILAVLDGAEIDSGVAFEIGYAVALGKPVVGLKTDTRTFSFVEEVNLMLEVPLSKICKSIEEVLPVLDALSDK